MIIALSELIYTLSINLQSVAAVITQFTNGCPQIFLIFFNGIDLLKLDTNELLHNEFDLLLNITDEEKKIANDMFSAASEFESSICASSNINELISINKNMQNTIDDIIIEEYMLYKKAQNIINGT